MKRVSTLVLYRKSQEAIMKFFNSDTKFTRFMAGLTDVILLGLLWCVFAVTIVGIGPASSALYYAIAKSVRRERGSPFKEFFRAIKEGWKNTLVVGLFLLLLVVGIFLLDGYALISALVAHTIVEPFRFVCGVLEIFFLLTIAVYAFPLASRFEMRSWNIIIVSVSLVFRYFGKTLLMTGMLAAVLLFLIGLPEFVVLAPGVFVYFLTYPMEKVLGSYLRLSGFEIPEDEDTWYLE